jgi:hypothetical protein
VSVHPFHLWVGNPAQLAMMAMLVGFAVGFGMGLAWSRREDK